MSFKSIIYGFLLASSTAALAAPSSDFTAWRLSADQLSFNAEKTASAGVDDSTLGLGMAIDIKRDYLVGGFGMYIGSLDDSNGFSQTVRDQYGNISEADSSVSALSFFAEIGGSYLLLNNVYGELVTGYQTMSVDRSISDCDDCESQDIPLDGGLYVKPRIKVGIGKKYILSASYMSYLSGDITNGLAIGFEGRF